MLKPWTRTAEPVPSRPWRVVSMSSWGSNTLFESATYELAAHYFATHSAPVPQISLQVQAWNGSRWANIGLPKMGGRR